MRVAVAACLAGVALLAGGCDEKEEATPPPDALVERAARATFAESELAVDVRVRGAGAAYTATGLEQPSRGRFLVDAARPGAQAGQWDPDERVRVVSQDGEGNEATSYVQGSGLPLGHGRCWFNPHSPVGFYDEPLSVEESMRLVGSVLESLRSEIASARARESTYEVTLRPSASHPRNDFRPSKQRVWGARNLIPLIDGPIEVVLADDGVERLVIAVRDVRLSATFTATEERLRLNQPNCLAMQ